MEQPRDPGHPPDWQWWVAGAAKADYDPPLAYDGGTSLLVTGATATVWLYKTALRVSGGERARLRFQTDQQSGPELGLYLQDVPSTPVWLPTGAATSSGWTTAELPLTAYAGRTIAAIALRTSGNAAARLSLGELALLPTSAVPAPARPTGFKVDEFHPDEARIAAELSLSWDFQPQNIWYYDIWRGHIDGTPEHLGRTLDGVYYVKSLTREGDQVSTSLRIVAVSTDGTRSAPSTVQVSWT